MSWGVNKDSQTMLENVNSTITAVCHSTINVKKLHYSFFRVLNKLLVPLWSVCKIFIKLCSSMIYLERQVDIIFLQSLSKYLQANLLCYNFYSPASPPRWFSIKHSLSLFELSSTCIRQGCSFFLVFFWGLWCGLGVAGFPKHPLVLLFFRLSIFGLLPLILGFIWFIHLCICF